jgi:ATP-dependent HslUV protease ATP-binding subunit HslU
MTREEIAKVRRTRADAAEERILDAAAEAGAPFGRRTAARPRDATTRQKFRKMLREGELDDREIEIELRAPVGVEIMAPPGMEEMSSSCRACSRTSRRGAASAQA